LYPQQEKTYVDLTKHCSDMSRHPAQQQKGVNASVKNMVLAMGTATATRLCKQPRATHRMPPAWHNRLTVVESGCPVLNISLRTTSIGFVSTAPATPAETAFFAEWTRRPAPSSESTAASHCPMKFLTATAIMYFGTVFIKATLVPNHQALIPCVSRRCPSTAMVGNHLVRENPHWGSWSVIDALVNGWFTIWTNAEMAIDGTKDATAGL